MQLLGTVLDVNYQHNIRIVVDVLHFGRVLEKLSSNMLVGLCIEGDQHGSCCQVKAVYFSTMEVVTLLLANVIINIARV